MKNTNTMTKNNNNTKPVTKPVAKPVTKPVVIIKPEPMQWKHYD
jgi:hypothetical protein